MINRSVSIAPMMGATDRHYRMLMRQMTRRTLLYTEMLTTNQVLRGKPWKTLVYSPLEHPVALQLGGSDPRALAECAKIAFDYGYDEVNLNAGCPSSRACAGDIGACLLKTPELVAECISSMQAVVPIPVTIKTRIGVDQYDSYEYLHAFVKQVSEAGCRVFIIHARKAWLKGLNPRQNRTVPPLSYDRVYQLKRDYPKLEIILNGGIRTIDEIHQQLEHVDGVMIGREAYSNPFMFAEVDHLFFGEKEISVSREMVLQRYQPYIARQLEQGIPFSLIAKHLNGLFTGEPHAKAWRNSLGSAFSASASGVRDAQFGGW